MNATSELKFLDSEFDALDDSHYASEAHFTRRFLEALTYGENCSEFKEHFPAKLHDNVEKIIFAIMDNGDLTREHMKWEEQQGAISASLDNQFRSQRALLHEVFNPDYAALGQSQRKQLEDMELSDFAQMLYGQISPEANLNLTPVHGITLEYLYGRKTNGSITFHNKEILDQKAFSIDVINNRTSKVSVLLHEISRQVEGRFYQETINKVNKTVKQFFRTIEDLKENRREGSDISAKILQNSAKIDEMVIDLLRCQDKLEAEITTKPSNNKTLRVEKIEEASIDVSDDTGSAEMPGEAIIVEMFPPAAEEIAEQEEIESFQEEKQEEEAQISPEDESDIKAEEPVIETPVIAMPLKKPGRKSVWKKWAVAASMMIGMIFTPAILNKNSPGKVFASNAFKTKAPVETVAKAAVVQHADPVVENIYKKHTAVVQHKKKITPKTDTAALYQDFRRDSMIVNNFSPKISIQADTVDWASRATSIINARLKMAMDNRDSLSIKKDTVLSVPLVNPQPQ